MVLQTAHPLRDPRFPFNVKLVVDGRERRGEFKSNPETGKEDYVVTFRHGEVYSIWVENKSRRIACCRLLVDGLNTLPEKSQTKGIAVLETAPRVNLATCRAWILDPFPPGKRPQTVWAVDGFFTNTGKDGQLREFKVTDADASVAARRGFTDQVGLITAAFYHKQEPIDASSGLDISRGPAGTDFGLTRDAETDERKHVVPGDLWGIVNIRYVLED